MTTMPTAGPIETAQSLCNRLFPHYEPDRIAASTAVSVRDAQWSAHLAEVDRENWTPTLIDALNSFVRENAAKFDPCKDGPSAADLIRDIHGEYNGLRSRLAEAEATRDACLSMATVGLKTADEEVEARQPVSRVPMDRAAAAMFGDTPAQWMRRGMDEREQAERSVCRAAKAMGIKWPVVTLASNDAYALQHDPNRPDKETTMNEIATPPRPDLSKWPEWELTGEWRPARRGELVYGGGNEIWPWGLSTPSNHPLWILRRRTPAPSPNAADEAEVGRLAKVASDAFRFYAGDGPKVWWYVARSVRDAVIAAQRPKAVDVEEAAKAAQAAWVATFGDHHTWEGLGEDTRRAYRKAAAIVIRLCGCTVAETKPDLIERMNAALSGGDPWAATAMLKEAAAEIERLRGE